MSFPVEHDFRDVDEIQTFFLGALFRYHAVALLIDGPFLHAFWGWLAGKVMDVCFRQDFPHALHEDLEVLDYLLGGFP